MFVLRKKMKTIIQGFVLFGALCVVSLAQTATNNTNCSAIPLFDKLLTFAQNQKANPEDVAKLVQKIKTQTPHAV